MPGLRAAHRGDAKDGVQGTQDGLTAAPAQEMRELQLDLRLTRGRLLSLPRPRRFVGQPLEQLLKAGIVPVQPY